MDVVEDEGAPKKLIIKDIMIICDVIYTREERK